MNSSAPHISLTEAITLLSQGKVGVIPTDTVYGLVARALDPTATRRLYALKHREKKPGTLIAGTTAQLTVFGTPLPLLERLSPYWPGPLSAVLPLGESFEYLHQGLGTLAMRVVADTTVRDMLLQTGPLITSSANQPGEPGSNTIEEAEAYFGGEVDFYVDGGDLSGRPPSTIVKPEPNGTLTLLRPGALVLDSFPK